MTYSLADRAAAEGCPMLEVRRVALNDGSHASLILENGRISKLVSPSGEVARLQWEEDKPSPRQSASFMGPVAENVARWGAPKMQDKETFVSARQFWASLPEAPKGLRKAKSPAEGRSSVMGCSTAGASDTSEVTSPSPKVSSEAKASVACTTDPSRPAAASTANIDSGSSGSDLEGALSRGSADQPQQCCATDFLPSTSEAGLSAEQDTSQLASDEASCALEAADAQRIPEDSSAAPGAQADSCTASQPNVPQSEQQRRQQEEARPLAAAADASAAPRGTAADFEPSRSVAKDTLEMLLGDAPKLDLRRMRAEVAGLPQFVSAEERYELAAGVRVKRNCRGAVPRQPPAPSPAPAAPADADGWPPRSAIFEPSYGEFRPGADPPASPPTAAQPQQQQRRKQLEPASNAACQISAGVSSGESVASPAAAGSTAGTSSGDSTVATGPSTHSVTSAARRRHSLADIRRAIAAIPSGTAGLPNQHTGLDLASALLVPAAISTTEKTQKKAKNAGKPTVWRKITAAFNARRVQPQETYDTGSPAGSAGAVRPGSPSSSCSSGGSCTKRTLAQRLFGGRGFGRRVSACSEAHSPIKETHPADSPIAVRPVNVKVAPPAAPAAPGRVCVEAAARLEQRGVSTPVEQGIATPTSVSSHRSTRRRASHQDKAQRNRTGMAGRWRLEPCERALAGMEEVEALLDLPLLQRLAMHRAVELEILETDDALTIVQDIPLNGSGARIRRRSAYAKNGAVVEETRADSREGVLRSQLTISLDGHLHIRSLQGDPYAAVFHKRIKMSSGGHRIKVEQKFQLLAPGVLPVKYHSIWHRIEDENSASSANAATQQETVL